MKKFLSLLMALVMALGCTAFAEGVDYTGTWVLTGLEGSGIQMGPTTLEVFGMTMTLVLNEDGTCVLDASGEVENGVWYPTDNGVAIDDNIEVVEFTYVNDMLVTEAEGAQMMLTREGAAPAVAESAGVAALTGVPAEAFEGMWGLASAELFGMEITAEEMGTYIFLELAGGVGTYTEMDTSGAATQAPITYEVVETETFGTILTILYQDETLEAPVTLLELNMLEDGRLTCSMNVEGLDVAYYFIYIPEEAME